MRLPRWFRRTRPTPPPPPRMDPHEAIVLSAWGFTPAQWSALDNTQRAYFRTNYTKAPRRT